MHLRQLMTFICVLAIAMTATAEVPNTISYQGRLTDSAGEPLADGGYLVKFSIYDAALGGTLLWNSGFQAVNTTNGLFSYQLGSTVAFPSDLFSSSNRYLGITVGVDAELTPRTQFVTVPYALTAGTVDWNDITSVPSGFADNVDNGMDNETADEEYVNVYGDTIVGGSLAINNTTYVTRSVLDQGSVQTNSTAGALKAKLFSVNYGELNLYDSEENKTVSIDANFGSGGSLLLDDPNGINGITLSAAASGDNTAILPDNSINSNEILNEPGITQSYSTTINNLDYTDGYTMQDIITTTITIPAPGYIFLLGNCGVTLYRTQEANAVMMQIDEEEFGYGVSPSIRQVRIDSTLSTDVNIIPASMTRIYYKSSAGTYTFRIEAVKWGVYGDIQINSPQLIAMYIPTSYGTVSTVSDNPEGDPNAKLVRYSDEHGISHTGYEVDLRSLELKAKEAQLKAKEAELELLKAQQQQQ